MAEDKDKIVETPEVPEVETMEEDGVGVTPEGKQEETLIVSETERSVSPVSEPVEIVETTIEEEVAAPDVASKDEILPEKKKLKHLKFLHLIMQMSHFWQTTVSNQE